MSGRTKRIDSRKNPSGTGALSRLLAKSEFPVNGNSKSDQLIKSLQLRMLRIQQGIWHSKRRAIVVFEGFDASGKGGTIRRLTEALDPRSFRVYPIGPPTPSEQGRHYLYRFWINLPEPGMIAFFDRSWYGRVLVERVEKLTPKDRWKDAYAEINEFEAMLVRDGIDLVKVFLAIHPLEQFKRFEARLRDPYKQWKLSKDDVEGHNRWDEYVTAADELLRRTNRKSSPWHLIPADSKDYARLQGLKIVTESLGHHGEWMEKQVAQKNLRELEVAMEHLEKAQNQWKKR